MTATIKAVVMFCRPDLSPTGVTREVETLLRNVPELAQAEKLLEALVDADDAESAVDVTTVIEAARIYLRRPRREPPENPRDASATVPMLPRRRRGPR
jgi:hypothetical protein